MGLKQENRQKQETNQISFRILLYFHIVFFFTTDHAKFVPYQEFLLDPQKEGSPLESSSTATLGQSVWLQVWWGTQLSAFRMAEAPGDQLSLPLSICLNLPYKYDCFLCVPRTGEQKSLLTCSLDQKLPDEKTHVCLFSPYAKCLAQELKTQ